MPLPPLRTESLLDQVIELCRKAGEAILEVYHHSEGFDVDTKSDDSPVTAADLAAHSILEPGLQSLLPNVPVLSEEGTIPDYEVRRQWPQYWLIDPLDGTKEFVNRNGEFTVNVAFVHKGRPILGVVHVPVTDVTYGGYTDSTGKGVAFKYEQGQRHALQSRSVEGLGTRERPVMVVASRNHGAAEVAALLNRVGEQLGEVNTRSLGSSLKLCLIAEGAADLYPRLAPTCEWDTAAAQAIVEAAGGAVLNDHFEPLQCNQGESLLNPHFFVVGDPQFDWAGILES